MRFGFLFKSAWMLRSVLKLRTCILYLNELSFTLFPRRPTKLSVKLKRVVLLFNSMVTVGTGVSLIHPFLFFSNDSPDTYDTFWVELSGAEFLSRLFLEAAIVLRDPILMLRISNKTFLSKLFRVSCKLSGHSDTLHNPAAACVVFTFFCLLLLCFFCLNIHEYRDDNWLKLISICNNKGYVMTNKFNLNFYIRHKY